MSAFIAGTNSISFLVIFFINWKITLFSKFPGNHNFASLIFSYDKTKQLLNSTLSNKFNIDLSNSFIDYKLQKLVEITENIYSNFNINLEDPNFNFFKQYFKELNLKKKSHKYKEIFSNNQIRGT